MLIKQLHPIVQRLWHGIKLVLVKSLSIVAAVADALYTHYCLSQFDPPGIYLLAGHRGSIYVGSATWSVRRRWREHWSALRRNAHHNTPMQDAWNSGERFVGLLLEPLLIECPLRLVEERERHWIAVYGDEVLNILNSTHRGARQSRALASNF